MIHAENTQSDREKAGQVLIRIFVHNRMKKQIFCIAIFLVSCLAISAQTTNKTVEKIQKLYSETAEKARLVETDDDQGEFGPLFVNELTVNSRNHQWRAVGIHQISVKFFYKAVENNENRLYPDQLVYVKSASKESNRAYVVEYLFSEQGELILYSQQKENDDQTPTEQLIYFSRGAVIRVINDGKPHDKFSAAEMKNIAEIKRDALKLKGLFFKSIDL